ncbi:MAG: flavodoxin domain-containing protein [Candidatus Methanomethylicia archaeon]|nr:flavodoxin domain-containing protein [Candidatus Methanomethylicia archaeon]
MSKALIVYGTRTGTAAITAKDIVQQLQSQGVETRVVDAKKEKVESIAEYDLIVVGSGIQMDKWTGDADSFLKRFHKELARKKVALFVNCGSAAEAMNPHKPEVAANARRKYLEEKASHYGLKPVALGFFGAIYNFNTMSWIMRKGMEQERPKLAAAYKETEPGVYDTRDIDGIREWARGLLAKI